MRTIIPEETATKDLHQYLLGAVSPRPIAFASTINDAGVHNLAPYSFFNCFSSNPPILVFSSNRRVSNNTTKDTLANIKANGEVVINVVNHAIVRQMTLASIEFPTEDSEFEKSGLTPIASDLIAPMRVAESPVQMECKMQQIITLGEQGGAGHLIICKVVRMHIHENILDDRNRIDPHKIDLMGRMGRAFYVRASGAAVQPILQNVTELVIGYDALPDFVKGSHRLTGNHLGQLGGLVEWPSSEQAKQYCESKEESKNGKFEFADYSAAEIQAEILLNDGDQRAAAAHLLQYAHDRFTR